MERPWETGSGKNGYKLRLRIGIELHEKERQKDKSSATPERNIGI
jgi:hypothetical protein